MGYRNDELIPKSMTIHLIEKSQTLIRIQGEQLSKYNVEWHETVESLPQKPVFFIANEFFDALPIRQFRKDNLGWREILIGIEKNGMMIIGRHGFLLLLIFQI